MSTDKNIESGETDPLKGDSEKDSTEDVNKEGDVTKPNKQKRKHLILIMAAAAVVIIMLLMTLTIILLLVMTVAAAPQCNTPVVPPVADQLLRYDSDKQIPKIPEVNNSPDNSNKDDQIGSAPYSKPDTSIAMIDRPQTQTVALGGTTTLKCTFSDPVPCNWKRNDQPVSIDGRYSYVSKRHMAETSTDCSITITKVASIDIVKWTCELKSTDSDDYEPIDSADVYIFEDKTKVDWYAKLGSTVQLECRFEEETDCVWLRNGSQVNVAGRYRYTNGPGARGKDCGLTIFSFANYDVGTWKCLRPGDSVHPTAVVQNVITLKKST